MGVHAMGDDEIHPISSLTRQLTTRRNVVSPPPERIRVILAFTAVAFLQGVSFATFALVPELSIRLLPTLTTGIEGWTLNCNNIAQMVFIPLAIFLLRKRRALPGGGVAPTGLRVIAVIAVCCQFLQSILWFAVVLVPPHSALVNVLVIIGSCSAGVTTGCVQGACSRLSAVWFPPAERGSATGSVYASLFLGQAGATAASLFFCSEADIWFFLLGQLIASVLLGTLILVWFPDRPGAPACGSACFSKTPTGEPLLWVRDTTSTASEAGFGDDRTVRVCGRTFQFRHPGLLSLLILLAVSWSTGGYQAYQQVLPLVFANEGSAGARSCNQTLSQQFEADEGDLFALCSGITYAIGGPVAGVLADRYFVRRLKLLMLLCFLALGLTFGFIIFTMPPPPFLNSGTSAGVRFGPGGEYLSLFAVSLSGLFAGMTATPALELLAEAQTLSEGASANLVMFGIQIFAIIVTYLTNVLATQGLSVVLCVSVFCCIVVLLFVKEVYLRLDSAASVLTLRVSDLEQSSL